jgi:isochorismate pyruvate lyase
MSMPQTTPPEQCATLEDIRAGMDALDREIVSLLKLRVAYVRAAAKFKTSAEAVAAPDRVQKVLDLRRDWAAAAGLDGDVIRALYRDLVAYCIGEEKKEWDRLQSAR